MDTFHRQGHALVSLRDFLGDTFNATKAKLIQRALSMSSAREALSALHDAGLITESEFQHYVAVAQQETAAPATTASANYGSISATANATTLLSVLRADMEKQMGLITPQHKDDLAIVISKLGVSSVGDVLEWLHKDTVYRVFDELLSAEQKNVFIQLARYVRTLPFVQGSATQPTATSLCSASTIPSASSAALDSNRSRMLHLWGENAQMLVVQMERKNNVFCYIEEEEGSETSANTTEEQVFFYLDISASMNHDSEGLYCAPNSTDHVDSSIKKARDLIPPLVIGAVRRGSSVTVVPWNYKLSTAIKFTAAQFTDTESGELFSEERMTEEIKNLVSDNIFKAKGGTNIEAALLDIGTQLRAFSNASSIVIWFLTDGEETVYLQSGAPDQIPSNTSHPRYKFFTAKDSKGLTGYQQQMIETIQKARTDMGDTKCIIDFHVCHMKDAQASFLQGLRAALGGHFHPVRDVANIANELRAQASSTQSSMSIIGGKGSGAVECSFPAGFSDGALCCRGVLSDPLCDWAAKGMITIRKQSKLYEMQNYQVSTLGKSVEGAISAVIGVEERLSRIITELGKATITPALLTEKAAEVKTLRATQVESIALLSKAVRSGTILQAYLEKVLDSVESQMDSLTRLLEQYQIRDTDKFNATAAQNTGLFRQSDKEALSAGLESMRVRLGHGFVSQTNLDRQVQRLVAMQGPRARKMLNRVCILAETPNGDETRLSLFVVEGDEHSLARKQVITKLASSKPQAVALLGNPQTQISFTETVSHNREGQVRVHVVVELANPPTSERLEADMSINECYPKILCKYHCNPKTVDLEDACKRFIDPLSFATFVELIRERNTLPACLYTIAPSQSIGLLFNAKELLYVVSGGADMTSFDYFRLYWRLAKKEDASAVTVPGCFHKANFALPLAPEPLTNMVLSNLMTGLMSEFITGTPMAPLTATGHLYIGYLNLHMRAERHTGLDVTRIAELLSSLAVWIQNPHTQPKQEEFDEMLVNWIKNQSIPTADSPGKYRPEKAFAYTLIDTKHPVPSKFEVINSETMRRYMKQLFVLALQKPNQTDSRVPDQLAKNQIVTREFMKELVEQLAQGDQGAPASSTTAPTDITAQIPVGVLNTAKKISALLNDASETEVTAFLANPKVCSLVFSCLRKIFIDKLSAALPPHLQWQNVMRMMYVWFSTATYPVQEIMDAYRAFKAPTTFEKHLSCNLALLQNSCQKWENVITSWLECEQETLTPVFASLMVNSDSSISIRRSTSLGKFLGCESVDPSKDPKVLCKAWNAFSTIIGQWSWRGSASSCYGLHEVDWDVVRAIADSKLVDSLSQTQLSEYNAAKEWRNANYARFVSAKPEVVRLSAANHVVMTQQARSFTGKPRLCLIFIGDKDSGKSTTIGHLVVKCGHVDQRTLDRIEYAASSIGKTASKFAWILDKLRAEREQSCTIETAIWGISTPKYEVDILDAPGTRQFVKNMAVGSSLADVAVLLVSAAPGEFESGIMRGGMTREEAQIAITQGIKQFIIVVNKMDTVNYQFSRFTEVQENLVKLLTSMGVQGNKVAVIPISGWQGVGLTEKQISIPWYAGWTRVASSGEQVTGYTLMDAIDACDIPLRMYDSSLRIPIQECNKIGGVGTVAIGRVASGSVKVGDVVTLMPSRITTTVGSMEIHHGQLKSCQAGDNLGLNLRNVSCNDVSRGMVLCINPGPSVGSFVAQVIVLSHPGQLHVGYTPFFFAHTASFAGRFVRLIQKIDRRSGTVVEDNPKAIKTGDCCLVQIQPTLPVYLEPFKDCPPLGRFVMQDPFFCSAEMELVITHPHTSVTYQEGSGAPTKKSTSC
ncbi:translation elongation factor 1a [Pelomyxa schiedti]|nr:translation elongation factor 1a [Pelomyxa schiedti]